MSFRSSVRGGGVGLVPLPRARQKRSGRHGGGSTSSPLGSGTNSFHVAALTVFDDGGGPALYVGGIFTTAGGVSANNIAKWNGATWSSLGSGTGGPSPHVYALTVLDDGSGSALYAGGSFASAGGVTVNGIAKWDGSSWSPLGSGVGGPFPLVHALTVFNDRSGPAIYAGGLFGSVPESQDSYLAKWGCLDTNPPSITCASPVRVFDRGAPGEVVTFVVTALDEEDPTPSIVCDPPSGSFFPRGTTVVTCTATDFSGNQSTCELTVRVAAKLREL